MFSFIWKKTGGVVEKQGSLPSGKRNVLSAMFLVGGTCIGGGMLALPVATGISGFIPSMVVMFVCWMAMTATALLLLEVTLWMEEGAHVITMTSRILGPFGSIVSWVLYLFICYASIVAYTAAGGAMMISFLDQLLGVSLGKELGCLIFILLFGLIVDLGTQIVGRVNFILFISMIAAYFALVGMGISEVRPSLLLHQRWSSAILAIPLLLTSFSFQTMVPSLAPYLKRNAVGLRIAIIGGTFIAFIVYAIWQWMMLGIVPVEGSHGLAAALSVGSTPIQFLKEHVNGEWIVSVAEYFAFFALVTSFLGIALGLFDFLSDGLKIKKEGKGKLFLGLLIIVPTFVFSAYFERIFLLALETSGGFGDSILNGILPVLMVWVGRYYTGYSSELKMPGGKPLLLIILIFFIFSLCLEIFVQAGFICSMFDYCKLYYVPNV